MLSSVALACLLTGAAAPLTVLAQSGRDATTSAGSAARSRLQETREQMRTRKIDRAKAYGRRMVRREQAAIDRLNRMIERVERRVAKVRTAGKDVSALEPLIATAKAKRDAAIAAVREAHAKYELLGTTDNPRQVAQEANEATKRVKAALVELREALRQVVAALKVL